MTTNLKQIFEIQENLLHRHCYQFDGGFDRYLKIPFTCFFFFLN